MWLWTRQEAKRIDELTIQSGISAETLMETAGQKSAAQILALAPLARKALVLCGPGNNGGDGFVVARELIRAGLDVTVVETKISGSPGLRSKKRSEFPGHFISADDFLKRPLEADLWIDALYGIGLSRSIEGTDRLILEFANRAEGLKVAIDTPSGLDVDTGHVLGIAFHAQWTLTVGHPKPGFFLNEGPAHCGKLIALDIGFPHEISHKEARSVFLLSRSLARRWLPKRNSTDNKTKGGRALIWAGSSEMPGAAILACRAAARVGAGYVFCSQKEVLKTSPEVIPWRQDDLSKFQSVLMGPGLGTGPATAQAIEKLKASGLPVVIDADALTVAAREKMYPFPRNWIATPHAGELSRFLQTSAKDIESDRLYYASQAQQILGCPVLLKGFHSVVAFPSFSVVVPTGNVALAKGGSGDVLGGMMTGLLSQGLSPERSALLATYLHGQMADDWIHEGMDFLSLTPSDLLERLPRTIRTFRKPVSLTRHSI